jgi:hypothetical protein
MRAWLCVYMMRVCVRCGARDGKICIFIEIKLLAREKAVSARSLRVGSMRGRVNRVCSIKRRIMRINHAEEAYNYANFFACALDRGEFSLGTREQQPAHYPINIYRARPQFLILFPNLLYIETHAVLGDVLQRPMSQN